MTREQVFDVVRTVTAQVLPDVDAKQMTLDGQLADLGANSIDRADIATMSMRELGAKVPAREFSGVSDIRTLVELLERYAR